MLATLLLAMMMFGGVAQDLPAPPADSPEGPGAKLAALSGPEGPVAADGPAAAARLSGTWSYNEQLSINAATGRPERDRATNQRRAAVPGSASRQGQASSSFGSTSGSIIQDALFNLDMMRRDTRRDLLEVAPELRIEAGAAAVAITDDLDRVLTFPADGTKHKYQLGAAVFEARSTWDGDRFVIDIEGPDGLTMSETLLLSQDASRLFVVIRVGEPLKNTRPVGVNRVYDRVPGAIVPGRDD